LLISSARVYSDLQIQADWCGSNAHKYHLEDSDLNWATSDLDRFATVCLSYQENIRNVTSNMLQLPPSKSLCSYHLSHSTVNNSCSLRVWLSDTGIHLCDVKITYEGNYYLPGGLFHWHQWLWLWMVVFFQTPLPSHGWEWSFTCKQRQPHLELNNIRNNVNFDSYSKWKIVYR
jgi:hypothetical protein